ncbi:MAG: hypothetical protein EXQ52_04715 [Bryobacterales bacterium]|nr:hypothetical protein [Bryobacterales bacterium]
MGRRRDVVPDTGLGMGLRPRLLLLPLLFSGCGRYTGFTLPALDGGGAAYSRLELRPAPVLSRGAPGEFDSIDALNPAVVKRGDAYFNFYSGYDGKTWHTGLATSADGIAWRKYGKVLSPSPATWEGSYIAANGAALFSGGAFLYWYHAGPRELPSIGFARSTDGQSWTKHPTPVLTPGPRGSWDERGVADPYAIEIDGVFYLYFLGQDRARRQRLGVARSRDGVKWEKLRTNPILELGDRGGFDERGLGEPAVWQANGSYWMLYTGRDAKEHRRLGLARSADGVAWRKTGTPFAGTEEWNGKVICDPSVEPGPEGVRVWFGGGDVASPDENLHGQIGFGVLR